ncbi:Ig-like domain repeat protein [Methanobrevibacter sp. TMH8]|uniref:Ig-like domain-containing protein n=1 Tax=Methanobrevibacter sp. TMH8 TaxID=2848611 RepID=UPI001CD00AA7|nr:Ig-like domain-containing protein [Methanobrevibacter sp. TMH8]MBZ9571655.1 Ig-like domain repeat protein [Methanobrevibacter sp. TMH8]
MYIEKTSKISKITFLLALIFTTILLSSMATNFASAADNTTLKIDESVGRFDTVSQLNAKLISNGTGVFNKKISFYVNNTYVGYNKTDSNGIAKINYLVTEVGTYNIRAIFAGDSNYLASENSSLLKVSKTPTVVEASNYLTIKKTVLLKAKLHCNWGNLMAGRTILFYVNGKYVGKGTTNILGNAYKSYKIKNPGTYKVTAIFEGESRYLKSQKVTTLIVPNSKLYVQNSKFLEGKYVYIKSKVYNLKKDASSLKIYFRYPKGCDFKDIQNNIGTYKVNNKNRLVTWTIPKLNGKSSTTFLLKLYPTIKKNYTVVQVVKYSTKRIVNKISFVSKEVKIL